MWNTFFLNNRYFSEQLIDLEQFKTEYSNDYASTNSKSYCITHYV